MSGRKTTNSRTRGSRKSALNALSRRKDGDRARDNKKQFQPYSDSNEGVDTRNHAREAGEMRKRHDVVEQTRAQYVPLAAARPKKAVPFDKVKPEDQNIFVVHIVSKDTKPCSTKPALRIMGAFRDMEDALEYSEEFIDPHFRNWDKHGFIQGQDYAMMYSTERQENEPLIIEKIRQIKEAHNIIGSDSAQRNYRVWAEEALKGREEEDDDEDDEETRNKLEEDLLKREKFKEESVFRKEQAATAIANQSTTRSKAIEAKIKERCQVNSKIRTTSTRVPLSCKIEGQNFAAISFLKDITPRVLKGQDTPEPMVIIWGAFKTLDDAEKWAKRAQSSIVDYNIDIVDMYVPLSIQHVNTENIETKYRHEHQNEIMGSIDRGHQHVGDFEEYCDGQGLDVPTTDIDIKDGGKVVKVTRKNQGMMNTIAKASTEIISKDLPTDSAKLKSDPLFVSKKDALKKLEAHNKIWENIPASKVEFEEPYDPTTPYEKPDTVEDAPDHVKLAIAELERKAEEETLLKDKLEKIKLSDDAVIKDGETQ